MGKKYSDKTKLFEESLSLISENFPTIVKETCWFTMVDQFHPPPGVNRTGQISISHSSILVTLAASLANSLASPWPYYCTPPGPALTFDPGPLVLQLLRHGAPAPASSPRLLAAPAATTTATSLLLYFCNKGGTPVLHLEEQNWAIAGFNVLIVISPHSKAYLFYSKQPQPLKNKKIDPLFWIKVPNIK